MVLHTNAHCQWMRLELQKYVSVKFAACTRDRLLKQSLTSPSPFSVKLFVNLFYGHKSFNYTKRLRVFLQVDWGGQAPQVLVCVFFAVNRLTCDTMHTFRQSMESMALRTSWVHTCNVQAHLGNSATGMAASLVPGSGALQGAKSRIHTQPHCLIAFLNGVDY